MDDDPDQGVEDNIQGIQCSMLIVGLGEGLRVHTKTSRVCREGRTRYYIQLWHKIIAAMDYKKFHTLFNFFWSNCFVILDKDDARR